MTEPIRLLFSSDHHFGAPQLAQDGMADAFADTVFPLLDDTDIFFINGDFFDGVVSFDSVAFDPIYEVVMGVFNRCEQKGIALRVMQGTWSHDRSQIQRLRNFYRNGNYSFNFKLVDGITLEEIQIRDRALRILFVQDDLPSYKSSTDIVAAIRDQMRDLGWDRVDYGCMHGFFDFTFPKNISQHNVVVFQEEQFPFVRKLIDVGHVHQHRVVGNVISNGSFDRLCHGEEDPKGCIRVLDYPDHYHAQFVENKHAAIFNTLTFTDTDTTETLRAKITSHLDGITTRRRIHLRCIVASADHAAAIKAWLRDHRPDIACKISFVNDKTDSSIIAMMSSLITPTEPRIAPTPATIAAYIRDDIPADFPLTIAAIQAHLSSA